MQWDLWCFLSFGVHVEVRWWMHTNSGIPYGPYADIHLPCLIVSVGRNPIYSGEFELLTSYSRGGVSGNSN